ncbi:glycosyltransferase family 2 protein [Sodalis sp. RH15]|uniref:glycosyltransferase family 2 protein n=1 Tax=Sodalis sp. RH15 TaxID=3394330 RepID=UPI0039B46BFA
MSEPFFSIVIPTYKSSKTIARTLKSIQKQTTQDFEIIVVDDASDDFLSLAQVIEDFRKFNLDIKIHHFEENKNGAAARNYGIKKSSGKYIAFLDSDDEWARDKLLKYKDIILKEKTDKKIYYSQIEIISDGKKSNRILPKHPIRDGQSAALYMFGYAGMIQTSTIVLKREYALSILFNENYRRHQDLDFCVRASVLGFDFIMINESLSIYHVSHNVNISVKKESISYSKFWVKDMKGYLTEREISCFNAYILPFKYLNEGDKIGALKTLLLNAPKAGMKIFLFNLKNKLNRFLE